MRGRKALPTQIKKAKGTHRPFRDKDVPTPSSKKPLPPAWLNSRAKQIFRHMVKRLSVLDMASQSHTETIALLACRLEEVERYDKIINEQGYVYATVNFRGDKIIKVRPEMALKEKALKQSQQLLAEFGLTPASAQKAGTPKEKKKKHNEFEGF
jgi:P27 family predicted phage terminase small subunit